MVVEAPDHHCGDDLVSASEIDNLNCSVISIHTGDDQMCVEKAWLRSCAHVTRESKV